MKHGDLSITLKVSVNLWKERRKTNPKKIRFQDHVVKTFHDSNCIVHNEFVSQVKLLMTNTISKFYIVFGQESFVLDLVFEEGNQLFLSHDNAPPHNKTKK